jgi:lysophospholipase L1-like esterase
MGYFPTTMRRRIIFFPGLLNLVTLNLITGQKGYFSTMRFIILFLFVFILTTGFCQEALRFRQEVKDLKASDAQVSRKNLNLFTGSSSIRFWTDIDRRFSGYNVVNRGFGGSQMHELFYYAWDLIIDYKPKTIFIYEGDNDLSEGKLPEDILADANKVLKIVRAELGKKVKVYFITPKPSIRRWNLKSNYETYIAQLKSWASDKKNVGVVDVWTPMLTPSGDLQRDLFVEDDLHMNSKGYDIWEKVIRPYLKKR